MTKGNYQKIEGHAGVFKYVGKQKTAYGIDYYLDGKKHREIVGRLLGDATKRLLEVKQGSYLPQSVKKTVRLESIMSEYEKNQKGTKYYEGTQRYHLQAIKKHLGKKRLCDIGPQVIEEYKRIRSEEPTRANKKRSGASINRELETLRLILNKAVIWGRLEKNPFNRFNGNGKVFYPEHKRSRFLTREEIGRLLAVAKPYLHHIVLGDLFLGLRSGDLMRLTWDMIDFENSRIAFKEEKKNDEESSKPLSLPMIALLGEIAKAKKEFANTPPADAIKILRERKEYIFVGQGGGQLKDPERHLKKH